MPSLLRRLTQRSRPTNSFNSAPRKFKEKNIISAILGTATIVVLCASLAEPVWFRVEGGRCCHTYIGVKPFFSSIGTGNFEEVVPNTKEMNCEEQRIAGNVTYQHCILSKTLVLIQNIITFTFLAIFMSLFSFILDIIAPTQKPLWKVLKRYSFGHISSVLLCATIVGFCYWVSQDIYNLQYRNRPFEGSKVQVSFDVGVYLVTTAGGLAILATTSNLMRQYPTDEEEQAERLMEDSDEDTGDGWDTPVPPPYAP